MRELCWASRLGTDTFRPSAHGENAQEFASLGQGGPTPMETITPVTYNTSGLKMGGAAVESRKPGP